MSAVRRGSEALLLAALLLPAVAFVPGLMHVFDPPKSAAWELLVFPALCLALAGVPSSRPDRGAGLWWILWSVWGLCALWLASASGVHSIYGGTDLATFPFWYRARDWILRRWTFGLDLRGPGPLELVFRSGEALAAATLAERAARAPSVSDPVLGIPARLAFASAALWCLSAAASHRPDLAYPELPDSCGYLAAFAGVWLLARDARFRGKVLAVVLLGGVLNTGYGLAQSAGHDFLPWAKTFGGRASACFGNPDFLGGHLALLLPLALALALRPARRLWAAVAAWGVVVVLAAGLLASRTLGAWIAAAAGCAAVIVLIRRLDADVARRARRPLAVAGLAVLAGLGFVWLRAAPAERARLEGSGILAPGGRIYLMERAADLALRHPLLGVGPGAFRVWFPTVEVQGVDPADFLGHPYAVSAHGHNDFLQMAAESGWIAALLWAGLAAWVMASLVRGAGGLAPGEGVVAVGCLGALVALAVHGLANFPFEVVPTEATGWALAAVGLGLLSPAAAAAPTPGPPSRPRRRWLAVAVVSTAVLGYVGARTFFEEGLWWVGAGELGLGHSQVAAPVLLKALGVDRFEDRLWDLHGQAHFAHGDIWDSIGSLREAHRLDPYNAQVSLRLGMALIDNRLYDEAYAVLSRAADRTPNYPDLWVPLAAAAFQSGRYAQTVQACDWMLYYHLREEDAYTNKAAALGSMGRLQDAWRTLEEAQARLPGSGKVQLNLAITYYKMGLRRQAVDAWRKAAALIPADPQVDVLRKALGLRPLRGTTGHGP